MSLKNGLILGISPRWLLLPSSPWLIMAAFYKWIPPQIVCILQIVGLFSHYCMWLNFQTSTIYILIIYISLLSLPSFPWKGGQCTSVGLTWFNKSKIWKSTLARVCNCETQHVSCWLSVLCLLVQEEEWVKHVGRSVVPPGSWLHI